VAFVAFVALVGVASIGGCGGSSAPGSSVAGVAPGAGDTGEMIGTAPIAGTPTAATRRVDPRTPADTPAPSRAVANSHEPAAQTTRPDRAVETAATPTPRSADAAGSIHLLLTEPVQADASVDAQVVCAGGLSYHMATATEVDGLPVEASVDVPSFRGPGTYDALVALWVSTEAGTQGGEILTSVTVGLDLGGSLNYRSEGSRGSVVATLGWSCAS